MEFYCGNTANREEAILKRLSDEDEAEALATGDAREIIHELLKARGYAEDEIARDPKYTLSVGNVSECVSADFIVRIGGRSFMAIKCSMALESRERQIVQFSRVVEPEIIPYAVITDGLTAHMMDASTGAVVREGLEQIPTRQEAMGMMASPQTLPEARREREMRILLAFETASCPRVQKPEGTEGR